MFKKHRDASLTGFQGPFFPEILEVLNQIYDYLSMNGAEFTVMGRKIPEFFATKRLTTADQYTWFWGMIFNAQSGKIVILFPWGSDARWIKLNRSIAVHHEEGITAAELASTLNEIENALWGKYFAAGQTSSWRNRKIPSEIFGRTLPDGRKIVPSWYLKVRSHLHQTNDNPARNWADAKKWFSDQGWEAV